jgi:hypothetical protein
MLEPKARRLPHEDKRHVVVGPEVHDRLKAAARAAGVKTYALAEAILSAGLDRVERTGSVPKAVLK